MTILENAVKVVLKINIKIIAGSCLVMIYKVRINVQKQECERYIWSKEPVNN
jgi:hypothetical protein